MKTMYSGDYKKISAFFWAIRRHTVFCLPHCTPRKLYNLLRCLAEMRMKLATVKSHPLYLRIEACPYCNLQCPGCPLSKRTNNPDEHSECMDMQLFTSSVKDFLPYLFKINLYDEGEPLLNKEICKMIKHAEDNNVATCISSNFSLRLSDHRLLELLGSGLEHLIVAIDGSTQERYSNYRKGGNLVLVLNNLKRLMILKKSTSNTRLKVEMQFIDFDDNADEREAIAAIAQELKVWRFTVIQGSSPQGWEGLRFTGSESDRKARGCFHIWTSAHINAKGELAPCDYGEDHGMETLGNASCYRSQNLRNHKQIEMLRKSFADSNALHEICRHCSQCTNAGASKF